MPDKIQRAARARQKLTGEKYTVARRAVIEEFERAREEARRAADEATAGGVAVEAEEPGPPAAGNGSGTAGGPAPD